MPTPWAPSQNKGMSCACKHSDAQMCLLTRERTSAGKRLVFQADERCDCSCHERDWEDDEDGCL